MESKSCCTCGKEVTIASGRFVGDKSYCIECFESYISKSSLENKGIEKSHYNAALSISRFISFIGWIMVCVGVFMVFIGMGNIIGVFPGFMSAISGIILVAMAELTRAVIDNADSTRQILHFLKQKA